MLRRFVAFAAVVAGLSTSASAWAARAASPDGWFHTGDGVMKTSVAFLKVDVFAVGHDMKCLPEHRSKADVIAIECDKRLTWRMLRDVDRDDIQDALRKAYKNVAYHDSGRIARVLAAFSHDLKEGAVVTISYDAENHRTTFYEAHHGHVDVDGTPFMRATWSILFANADAEELGDELIRRL
ncbi:MAG TPA: chalcone isomerase family protein [Minicystis sp.]|nr:chalcone isomerase family protein [Minicystis sp.]